DRDERVVLQEVRWVESVPIPREGGGSAGVAGGCLVVHLRFPPGAGPFFVQPAHTDSWNPIRGGQIHRFYQAAGKYTGVFWPFTEEEADELRELYLISVPRLKEHANTLKVLEAKDLKGPEQEEGLGFPHHGKIRPQVP